MSVKHQCRFCSHLVTGNGIWCYAHQRCYSEAYTKRKNECKEFEFNPIDAWFINDYTEPVEPRPMVETLRMELEG